VAAYPFVLLTNFRHLIPNAPGDRDIPVVYKKAIVFFRSLYSLVRLLPCYRLSRIIGRQARSSIGEVVYRVSTSRISSPDEAGLNEIHMNGDMRRGISEFSFEPLQTPLGVFNLHVAYRLDCNFSIENADSSLSHRFVNQEQNTYQVPRPLRHQSSGSLQHSQSNSVRTRGTSNSSEIRAENQGVVMPPSIPVIPNRLYGFEPTSSPDQYRFRVDTLSRARKDTILSTSNATGLEHFTPPSYPSSSQQKRQVMKLSEDPPPFLVNSIPEHQVTTQSLTLEDLPFARPPFALPESVSATNVQSQTEHPLAVTRRASFTFPDLNRTHSLSSPSFQHFGISPPPILFESTAYHPTEINSLIQTINTSSSFKLQVAHKPVFIPDASSHSRDSEKPPSDTRSWT
jgi:Autophagy-related protein 13